MKVNIWVHRTDIETGKITKFYNICPQGSNWPDYYQIEVDQDTFVQLLDQENSDWIVNQYNRNRKPEDHIEKSKDIDYGGHDQDEQPFAD